MQNLKTFLTKLGITDVDSVVKTLTDDAENETTVNELLTKAQEYSKPFIETELKESFNGERKTLKGKYFKDAAQQVNKIFGSALTSGELDKILSDPENKGETFQAVVNQIKEKVSDKTGATDKELQAMLDAANAEKNQLAETLSAKEAEYQKNLTESLAKYKLDSVLDKRLVETLSKITTMSPAKAAELIRDKVGKKSVMKLMDDNNIELYDPANPDHKLKKNATELHTFESLVTSIADEYELPKIKSGGAQNVNPDNKPQKTEQKLPEASAGAAALASIFSGE